MDFPYAEQANEAIRSGLSWYGAHHDCYRLIPGHEVDHCSSCLRYGHSAELCVDGRACALCFRGHDTKDCIQETRECVLCGTIHKIGGKECAVQKQTKGAVRDAIRQQKPFWPVGETSSTADLRPAAAHTRVVDLESALSAPISVDTHVRGQPNETDLRRQHNALDTRSHIGPVRPQPSYIDLTQTDESDATEEHSVDDSTDELDQHLCTTINSKISMSAAASNPVNAPPQDNFLKRQATKSPERPHVVEHQLKRLKKAPSQETQETAVERYIRENKCIPVQQGRFRDALLEAGQVSGEPYEPGIEVRRPRPHNSRRAKSLECLRGGLLSWRGFGFSTLAKYLVLALECSIHGIPGGFHRVFSGRQKRC